MSILFKWQILLSGYSSFEFNSECSTLIFIYVYIYNYVYISQKGIHPLFRVVIMSFRRWRHLVPWRNEAKEILHPNNCLPKRPKPAQSPPSPPWSPPSPPTLTAPKLECQKPKKNMRVELGLGRDHLKIKPPPKGQNGKTPCDGLGTWGSQFSLPPCDWWSPFGR